MMTRNCEHDVAEIECWQHIEAGFAGLADDVAAEELNRSRHWDNQLAHISVDDQFFWNEERVKSCKQDGFASKVGAVSQTYRGGFR
jgi:hypothetical protein